MNDSESTVSRHGKTVIPAEIRRMHRLRAGDRLIWIDDGESISIVPYSGDAIATLRGCARDDDLLGALLEARREDHGRQG